MELVILASKNHGLEGHIWHCIRWKGPDWMFHTPVSCWKLSYSFYSCKLGRARSLHGRRSQWSVPLVWLTRVFAGVGVVRRGDEENKGCKDVVDMRWHQVVFGVQFGWQRNIASTLWLLQTWLEVRAGCKARNEFRSCDIITTTKRGICYYQPVGRGLALPLNSVA